MNIKQLIAFVELYYNGNIKEVASHLAITPSALLKRITFLEKELGTRLFDPNTGRQPTRSADELIQAAEDLLNDWNLIFTHSGDDVTAPVDYTLNIAADAVSLNRATGIVANASQLYSFNLSLRYDTAISTPP